MSRIISIEPIAFYYLLSVLFYCLVIIKTQYNLMSKTNKVNPWLYYVASIFIAPISIVKGFISVLIRIYKEGL